MPSSTLQGLRVAFPVALVVASIMVILQQSPFLEEDSTISFDRTSSIKPVPPMGTATMDQRVLSLTTARRNRTSIDAGKCLHLSKKDKAFYCFPSLVCIGAMKVPYCRSQSAAGLPSSLPHISRCLSVWMRGCCACCMGSPPCVLHGAVHDAWLVRDARAVHLPRRRQAGTFELKQWLDEHPLVATSSKERHFFGHGQALEEGQWSRYVTGPDEWRMNLREVRRGRMTFEKTPYYMASPVAALELHGLLPSVRLVVRLSTYPALSPPLTCSIPPPLLSSSFHLPSIFFLFLAIFLASNHNNEILKQGTQAGVTRSYPFV